MGTMNLDKIKIEHTDVWGFNHAMRGARNSYDSWSKNDTAQGTDGFVFIGDNDMELALKLIKAGPEHRKFMRMIHVSADLTLPRYIWSELDTYHFNTKNSCSTMHKLLNNKESISQKQFIWSDEDQPTFLFTLGELERMRQEYNLPTTTPEKKQDLLVRAKRILPEGFLQKRTFDTNYEELRNIYHQRKNHRLKEEWGIICDWIAQLPYANELLLS